MENNNVEKKKVAIYTRVSTDKQVNDGYGLEQQEKIIRNHCNTYNYEIYKIYRDEAASGKNTTDREEYNKMMSAMKNKKFDSILALKIDRISRDIVDFNKFLKDVEKHNCGVEFVLDKIDTTTAAGRMMANIIGVFAQFERELIVERTLIGVEGAVNKGHFAGQPPLGYKKAVDKTWVINDDEVALVKEIFNLCLQGNSYQQISNIFQEKYPNIVLKTFDKKNNKEIIKYRNWTDGAITTVLNNKAYIGIYEYRKRNRKEETIPISGKIPPIIDTQLFYDCQEQIQRNSRNYHRTKQYLFTGKLICPKCGRIMACSGANNHQGKEYLYYKCKDCKTYFREDLVERALVSQLHSLLELYMLVENNYFPIDSELAKTFNNCKTDNKIRFAIDSRIIAEKKNKIFDSMFSTLWQMTSYETKCKFIGEYIDTIKIKRYKVYDKNEFDIKLEDLQLRKSMLTKLFELKDKNMLDIITDDRGHKFTTSEFYYEREALDYIDILSKKFNFKVDVIETGDKVFIDPKTLFKIINIYPRQIIEKQKIMFLSLND